MKQREMSSELEGEQSNWVEENHNSNENFEDPIVQDAINK